MERSCELEGNYRYFLRIPVEQNAGGRNTLFILCNPSTADAAKDDPTTRNMKKWARGNGIQTVIVANLYAYRAKHPDLLSPLSEAEAVGKENTKWITRAADEADDVIVAWGNPPRSRSREEWTRRTRDVLSLLRERHGAVYCIGKTKSGHPRHPRVWYMIGQRRKTPY